MDSARVASRAMISAINQKLTLILRPSSITFITLKSWLVTNALQPDFLSIPLCHYFIELVIMTQKG